MQKDSMFSLKLFKQFMNCFSSMCELIMMVGSNVLDRCRKYCGIGMWWLKRECLVQDKKHTRKKALLTGYILDPTFTISKTLQQRKGISNIVWTKELKAMNMLKQQRDSFQCGGKDGLNLKLTFFIMDSFFRNLD